MAKSCRLSPVVRKRDGKEIVEKDSKLFKSIKSAIADPTTAWKLWAYTKTPEFKAEYKDTVEYDELGEVTFPSLIKALGLQDAYDSQKTTEEAARDYGFKNTKYQAAREAISKVNHFNYAEKKLIASLHKVDGEYEVVVSPKNGQTVEHARQQSYNYALTEEMLKLLQSMGFGVEWVSDLKYDGLFNPEEATFYNGVINIIQLAKGQRGEEALPEEFSHAMIEGLINHPLVQRLLNTLDDTQIREVLGDDYDRYAEKYEYDGLKLQKEAAGKLLAQYITDRGTISQPPVRKRRTLLSRIWKWIKDFFSKIKREDIDRVNQNAHEIVSDIYNIIASGDVIQLVDREHILSAEQLYKLEERFDSLEKVALEGEDIVRRMWRAEKTKSGQKNKERAAKTEQTLRSMQQKFRVDDPEYGEVGSPYDSIETFLGDAKRHIEQISEDMRKAEKFEKENRERGNMSDIHILGHIAKVVNEIDTFIFGYEDIIGTIATFHTEDNVKDLGISMEEGEHLSDMAAGFIRILNDLKRWRGATERAILIDVSRTVYKEDRVRGIGSRRDEVMKLEQVVDHAERDINVIDRWLSAMSDADDALLPIIDQVVKTQQYERDMEMIDWRAEIAAIDKEFRDAGGSTDFMYERDSEGVPTLRIISPYDWKGYNDALAKAREGFEEAWENLSDRKKKITGKREYVSSKIAQWKKTSIKGKSRLIKVYVDPEIEAIHREQGDDSKNIPEDAIFEMVPNPEVFGGKVSEFERLCPENSPQRKYYDKVMNIKRIMMTKIPHRGQGIYKTINISKDVVEGIFDNSTSSPISAVMDNIKKRMVRRPDDIGFGTHDNFGDIILEALKEEKDSEKAAQRIIDELNAQLDDDIAAFITPKYLLRIIDTYKKAAKEDEENEESARKEAANKILDKIASSEFAIVDTDFANHRIQRLPIYYTRPLRNKKMLSTDFSAALVAYSAMAVNYEKMNEVVDVLEVARKYVKERRGVRKKSGERSVMSKYTAFGKIYKSYVEEAGVTNIAGRIDDYMDSVVYEERKNDEGTIELFGINLDVAKTLDTIKDYTGLLGLGFNLFSTVSNIAVGKLQQWIEAAGGEYFTFKDYAKAVAQYHQLIGGCLAEMGSPVKKNKLSLLIQMFDPMGDFHESLRDPSFSKSIVSRILGNGLLAYIGMNAGEHMLHCQTMLAILNNIKLTNTETKEEISLFDALEVKEVDGIHRLVLKPNLAYERELIDNNGKPETNKNYGKPILDEDGKIKTEWVQVSTADSMLDAAHRKATRMLNKRHGTYSADEKPRMAIVKNFNNFIFKKRKIVRKVNDSLNGAFSANDKGAAHKKAVMRLVMQFRQWMPAHYMRRFARAHYDADLEQWREGYYVTVGKTLNKMVKESRKAKKLTLKYYHTLSRHEKANLKRASAELTEFLMLMALVRFGGRVKDRDRGWLEKMVLYQIRRMYLEVGASFPVNSGFFSNIFTLLQSPAASINTFEKISKFVQFWNMFDEIQSGRYQGWSEFERDLYLGIPAFGQIRKAIDFDDSMFVMFEDDD